MGKSLAAWTDERLDDLAGALVPLPAEVAALRADIEHLDHVAAELEPTASRVAVLIAAVDRLSDENVALRAELGAMQRQLIQIGWGLFAALLGAAAALTAALI
jgi:CelD/BcsL family acetyltransferase involved in cellulose biosynthesis